MGVLIAFAEVYRNKPCLWNHPLVCSVLFPRQRFVASAKLGSFLGSAFTGISDMIALVGGEGLASGVMMLIPF